MKQIRLVVMAAVLLLCACSTPQAIGESPVPLALPPDETSARQTLVFLLASTEDPLFREGAELFAEKVSLLTDGLLTIELRTSVDPVSDYRAGRGALIYLDSRRNSDFCTDFALLSTPLRYRDYESFSMALNSRKVSELLNDRLEQERATRLLAAFHQGSNCLVASQPLSGGALPADAEDAEAAPPLAAVRPVPGVGEVLQASGLQVVVAADPHERLLLLEDASALVAEFTPAEMLEIDWQDLAVYPILTGHSIAPRWLAIGSAAWSSLPANQQAAVQEAVACLFPVIDGGFLAEETEVLAHIRAQGLREERGFTALRTAAQELQAQKTYTSRETYLLGLLDNLE